MKDEKLWNKIRFCKQERTYDNNKGQRPSAYGISVGKNKGMGIMNTLLTYQFILCHGVSNQIKIADNLSFDFNIPYSYAGLGFHRKETLGGFL